MRSEPISLDAPYVPAWFKPDAVLPVPRRGGRRAWILYAQLLIGLFFATFAVAQDRLLIHGHRTVWLTAFTPSPVPTPDHIAAGTLSGWPYFLGAIIFLGVVALWTMRGEILAALLSGRPEPARYPRCTYCGEVMPDPETHDCEREVGF